MMPHHMNMRILIHFYSPRIWWCSWRGSIRFILKCWVSGELPQTWVWLMLTIDSLRDAEQLKTEFSDHEHKYQVQMLPIMTTRFNIQVVPSTQHQHSSSVTSIFYMLKENFFFIFYFWGKWCLRKHYKMISLKATAITLKYIEGICIIRFENYSSCFWILHNMKGNIMYFWNLFLPLPPLHLLHLKVFLIIKCWGLLMLVMLVHYSLLM